MEINQAVRWLLLSGSLLLALLLGWWLWSDRESDHPDLLEKVPVFEFPLIGRSGVVTRHQFRDRALVVSYFNPDCSHLICKNFSAPKSAPNPASVTTKSPSESPILVAIAVFVPCAILANGPPCKIAGFPSIV